jgi:aspartokinase/homoserine dehydrogenase 1
MGWTHFFEVTGITSMALRKVLKFGGSSVGKPERIRQIIDLVSDTSRYPDRTVLGVVVSAFGGTTDTLIELAKRAASSQKDFQVILKEVEARHLNALEELLPATLRSSAIATVKVMCNELSDLLHGVALVNECSARTLDHIMSFGERLSAFIVTQAFNARGINAEMLDSREVIKTDETFGNARVLRDLSYPAIQDYFAHHPRLQIITGFIGATKNNATTTLGRGGSDLTASLIGAALAVDEIEIWTDVDGMLTADPRKVLKAFPIPEVTFEEAMELCHFGAKVIYPPTMQPAIDAHIPLVIKNTLNLSASGTRIVDKAVDHPYPITGISSISSSALVRLQGSGMFGVAGTAARLFKALAEAKINVILITQASSEHTICCAIEPSQVAAAQNAVSAEFALEIKAGWIDPLHVEDNLSIISIVGERMRQTPGMSGRIFGALGANGVNVVAVAQGSSELNISAVISSSDEMKALNAIHDEFFISRTKTVNVWIIGTGLIGSTLLKQLAAEQSSLRDSVGLDLQLRGVANSRQMLLSSVTGPALPFSAAIPGDSQAFSANEFFEHILRANLPNSVFVDCTASDSIPMQYPNLLKHSIPVVTPNKRGFSSSMEFYRTLRTASAARRTPILHETSVGAALPILGTLSDQIRSGDKIRSIEAVLSGTLSFIFNALGNGVSFSSAVRDAKERGYTEPDPRDDLSGMDVARKVLILARDAGISLELSDVTIEPILPPEALNWSLSEFMEKLSSLDPYFGVKVEEASKLHHRLFFSAFIDCEKRAASIGIRSVGPEHPFSALKGADNIVAFTSNRYSEQPLVIKGPGAGAELTASGVFADIIRAAR